MVAMKLLSPSPPTSFFLLLPCLLITSANQLSTRQPRCVQLSLSQCRSVLPYNSTAFPNLAGDEDPAEAELALNGFTPLVQVNCHRELKFFLCSVYAPMCTPKVPNTIGPCRPICERVRGACAPTMSQFGFPWPPSLNCSRFPAENNEVAMCMGGPVPGPSDSRDPAPYQPPPPVRPHPCAHSHRYPGHYLYINGTGRCSLRCHNDDLYSRTEKRTAEVIVFVLAALAFTTGLAGLLLERCSSSRLGWPDQPLLFIVLCTTLAAVPHLFRFFAGREAMACLAYGGTQVLAGRGVEQIRCTVTGILVYFLGLAHRVWWVLLCWLTYLAAGRNWSPAALGLRAFGYHVVAWSTSVLGVVILLVRQGVDADELSGICGVGHQSRTELAYLVLAPELILLSLGAAPLLLLGLTLLCRRRDRKVTTVGETGAGWAAAVAALAYLPVAATLVGSRGQALASGDEARPPSFPAALAAAAAGQLYGSVAAATLLLRAACARQAPCTGRFAKRPPQSAHPGVAHRPLPVSPPPSAPMHSPNAFYAYRDPGARYNLRSL